MRRLSTRGWLAILSSAVVLFLAAGCADGTRRPMTTEDGGPSMGRDGGGGGGSDAGPGDCGSCDDGVDCTVDTCDAATLACVHTPSTEGCPMGQICDRTLGCVAPMMPCSVDADCDDGSACTGTETCDPTNAMADAAGCVVGVPMDCDDGLACTVDTCSDATGACVHDGTDTDADGYVAVGCGAGDDCNDADASINPGMPETCDAVDNDCSGTVDDGMGMSCVAGSPPVACMTACGTSGMQACDATCALSPCSAPEICNGCDDDGDGMADEGLSCGVVNDTCTTAIDITGGATVMGNTCGADNTVNLGCSMAGSPDVFYSITNGPAGGNYGLTVTPGFVVQYVPSICSGNGGCGAGGLSIAGGASTTWYFAIERSDGGCGAFTFTATPH